MNMIQKPGGIVPTTYNEISRPQEDQNPGASFSQVLDGRLREQATQKIMDSMSGLSGLDTIPGAFVPPSTAAMENTMVAYAGSGEMSGSQLMLFMMIMMMQTGDGGSDFGPIIQMISQMLSQATQSAPPTESELPILPAQYGSGVVDALGYMSQEETDINVKYMVDAALSQVGYHEKNRDGSRGRGNYTDFGAWYGMDGQPWCAMFVSWAADKAGILNEAVPRHASTSQGVKAYSEKGMYAQRETGYIPREGDAIYFNRGGRVGHVGIVVAYDPETQKVYTVEGNTDNAVRIRHYDANNPRINGYGRNGGTSFGRIPINSTSGTGANTV